jgi:hypothetical protein
VGWGRNGGGSTVLVGGRTGSEGRVGGSRVEGSASLRESP